MGILTRILRCQARLRAAPRVSKPRTRMFKRAVTLTVLTAGCRLPRRRRCSRALVAARGRLGARHRHEPVGRVWLRQARCRPPRDPRPLLPRHADRLVSGGAVRVLLQPNRSVVYFRHATQAGDRALDEKLYIARRAKATMSCCAARRVAASRRFAGRDARRRRQARAPDRARGKRRARRPLPRPPRDPHGFGLGSQRDQCARHRGLPAGRRPEREPLRRGRPRRSRPRPWPHARTRSPRT